MAIKLLLVALGTAALLPLASVPGHAAPPNRGCSQDFERLTIAQVQAVAAPGFADAIAQADTNGDGLLCYKQLTHTTPSGNVVPDLFGAPRFPTFQFLDNVTGNG